MTWFVDTNVLVYAITDGPRRPACRSLLRSIAAGDVAATTSTLVLEEFWHLEERLSLGDGAARAALEIFPYVIAVGDWGGPGGGDYELSIDFNITCPADTNHDGVVTPADFSAWVAAFNAMAPECDQNNDGMCTPADFSAWVANYNAGC